MYGFGELFVILMICTSTIGVPLILGLFFWVIYQRNQSMNPCVYCGAKMHPGDNFCANCGKPRAGRVVDATDV